MVSAAIPTVIVGNLAFGLAFVAYLLRDILWLRIFAVLSGLFGIAYDYSVPGGPLLTPIAWGAVFIVINTVQVILLVRERWPMNLSYEQQALHQLSFSNLTPLEFQILVRCAERHEFPAETVLFSKGEAPGYLYAILDGSVALREAEREVGVLEPGGLIGEVSFVNDKPFEIDLIVAGGGVLYRWDLVELRHLFAARPDLGMQVERAFLLALARGVDRRHPAKLQGATAV